jgi:hypothetical protein
MWMDDKGKKSRLSSPQYVDYVMTFVQKTANDEAIFPTKVKTKERGYLWMYRYRTGTMFYINFTILSEKQKG